MQKNSIKHLTKPLIFIFLLHKIIIVNGVAQSLPENNFATSPFTQCWELKSNSINSYASDNKFTVITETEGNILQINSRDQSQNWVSSIGNKLISFPYLIKDSYFILSRNTNAEKIPQPLFLRKLSKATGITEWITELNLETEYQTLINEKTNNLIIASNNLNIFSVNLETGKTNWKKEYTGNLKKISLLNDNTFLLLTTNNEFIETSLFDGSVIERNKIVEKQVTAFTVLKDIIIAGDKLGNVYNFQKNGQLSKKLFRTGGEITYIGKTDKNFYVVSNDNFIYLYSSERKKLMWKKRLSGRVTFEPIVEENTIIISTIASPDIYFLRVDEGNLINQIKLKNDQLIKDIQHSQRDIFVLTNSGLLKFAENCLG